MNSNDANREKEIFEQAVELASPDERSRHAREACGGDADLLARVQTLLRAYDQLGGFMEGGMGAEATVTLPSAAGPERTGTVIGRYKLLQKIGEGGCGTVYMAEQEVPVRRRVALKVIKLGMDTKEVIARFEAERQALAMMDHPNIARVLDAGATDAGRPYFVMELVRGIKITEYCDQNNLPTNERLGLFTQVCHAVQHAHQKGIIHRDIKPSNILVTLHDGIPVPKVIDFGIAKAAQGRLTDRTLFTAFEQFIGTPAYMSPEQAEMSSLDIDTRSDIYSLGVLLYELLTGRTPFEAAELLQAGLDEMRRQIREVEPQRPSARLRTMASNTLTTTALHRRTDAPRLITLVHGDLDWIVMRCLEKDRTRRYETATSLAQDIRNHLENEPVSAHSPSAAYRFRKLFRRHRVAFAAGTVIMASLVGGIVVSTLAYFNEKAAHQFAVEAAVQQQRAIESKQESRINYGNAIKEAHANEEKAAVEAARSAYAVRIMNAMVAGTLTERVAPEDKAQLMQVLGPSADKLEKDPSVALEAKQELCDTLGDAFMRLGEYPRAERMFRKVLEIRQQTGGIASPAAAAALDKLVESLRRQGKESEAEQVRHDAESARADYIKSEEWVKSLRSLAGKDIEQGQYASAEQRVREVMAVEAGRLNQHYDPSDDIGKMARIRFEAGDLAGARQLATQWISSERGARLWENAGTLGFLMRLPDTYRTPFDAHTLLGLVALREGNKAEAGRQLLESAKGLPQWAKIQANEVELAAALVDAGESATVVTFLDRLRPGYVDMWESRLNSTSDFFDTSWSDYFGHVATGRSHELQLEGWRSDVAAGRIPSDWREMLAKKKSLPVASGSRLAPLSPLPISVPRSPSFAQHPLLPCSAYMLGFCMVALSTRLKPGRRCLPSASGKWLVAFCAARTLDCALFAGTVTANRFLPDGAACMVISLASWAFLWEFIRTLMPASMPRWEMRIARATYGIAIGSIFAAEMVNYVIKDAWSILLFFLAIVFALLAVFALAIFGCIAGGVRLWKWSGRTSISRRQIWCLRIAAPLLALHGCAFLLIPIVQNSNRGEALALLWANALFPWLLAGGLILSGDTLAEPRAAAAAG
jgi:serine/threonine protein kinase